MSFQMYRKHPLAPWAAPGTGKTLTYLIPAIEHVIKNPPPGVGVLIMAPTSCLDELDQVHHGSGPCVGVGFHGTWLAKPLDIGRDRSSTSFG